MAPYLIPPHVGWIVSLGTGFTGIRLEDGYHNIRQAYYPKLALGLLYICQMTSEGNMVAPRSISHMRSDKANPVILDSRFPGYFWGKHPQQDTSIGQMSQARDKVGSQIINRLHDSISHFPPVEDGKELKDLFPAVAAKMHLESHSVSKTPENLVVHETSLEKHSPSFDVSNIVGRIVVSGELEITGSPKKNNALLSFGLHRLDEYSLTDEDVQALRAEGIFRSGDSDIGYFRYLPTARGKRTFHYTFKLPEGLACESISVRKFGRSESNIYLRRFTINTL
jgi:hypothetical protein